MALSAVQSAMNHDEQKSLHPFFSKPQLELPAEPLLQGTQPVDPPNDDPDYDQISAGALPEKAKKKRTRKIENGKEKNTGAVAPNQALLYNFARRPLPQESVETALSNYAEHPQEKCEDEDRRKRRKTASPESTSRLAHITPCTLKSLSKHNDPLVQQEETGANNVSTEQAQGDVDIAARPSTPPALAPTTISAEVAGLPEFADVVHDETTPKKQIKITKSGKLLSSPPKSKQDLAQPTSPPKKRRGRKPAKAKVSSTVAVIKYGTDVAGRLSIGAKIEAILSSPKSTSRRTAPKKPAPKPSQPPKVTHPFFRGKQVQPTEAAPKDVAQQRPPTPRKSAVTPGKLRAETRRDRSPAPMPNFGMSLGHKKVKNQSGLYEAPWPTKETAHVRNLGHDIDHFTLHTQIGQVVLHPRKSKRRPIVLKDEEEVISRLAKDIPRYCPAKENIEPDFAPPEHVRLPRRLLTTGNEIQRRVREQVNAPVLLGSEQRQGGFAVHPAVQELFADIEHTLSPFDEGRCESQAWVQKYSPKSASHVLQVGTEALILRDWLQSLTVMAVGGAQGSSQPLDVDSRKPPKKKRRRAVDDFIVDDDEDDEDEMIPFTDIEGAALTGSMSLRTSRWTRSKNVILISGPHGCGKSATVYAVAKELGFEVFEINSGTRRSGKDIQERVGDMTANHLVNHKRSATKDNTPAEDTETERLSTALQNDINTGRQGTMMSFFKSNSAAKPKLKSKVRPDETKNASASVSQVTLPITSATTNSQKQSLILFEEADILFEEDQQFWAQVTKLAAQSKRPIIITCNDEQHIPAHDLPLAARLRLRQVPIDLATDYLLVLAGREGHILERDAVAELYMSKDCDLRSSISELNFWCQMSVGDKKGGLEWMYQRWPLGEDTDAQSRLLRVASEHTYQSGMGFFSHNLFESHSNAVFDKEDALLKEIWQDWGLGPHDWTSPAAVTQSATRTNLDNLKDVDNYADTLSATDIYCRVGLPGYDHDCDQLTDPSLPNMTEKMGLSFTIAHPLLQVDHQADYESLDTAMYTQTLLLAGRVSRQLPVSMSSTTSVRPVTEADYSRAILSKRAEKNSNKSLSRLNFSMAYDILAAPEDFSLGGTSYNLTPTSFDRNFRIITQDLAPYVRSIVAHEQVLEEQRIRLSNLLSEGGKGKRPRTTRASRVALEGGVRETKRRERWFDRDLNFGLVMATAGKEWAGMGWKGEGQAMDEGTGSMTGTQDSLPESQDVSMQERKEI